MKNQNNNIPQDYKYGFTTEIDNIKAPKGLSEGNNKIHLQN